MRRMQINDPNGSVVYWKSADFALSRNTLFFLHGLTADHTMFESQIPVFERDYNIITWDAPAHGESRPYDPFTYGNAAKCMKSIIDECGIADVILIGQSLGGFISQAFISRYPELVKAFVSIDSTPYGDYYSKSDIWWLQQIEWMAKLFPEKLLKSSMAKQNAVTEHGQSNMASMLSGYSKSELCHLMGVGYAGFLEDNRELDISCPVLLIVGKQDNTGKVRAYNREWNKRTDFPLIWIDKAAHNANVDNSVEVNASIMEFIKSLR